MNTKSYIQVRNKSLDPSEYFPSETRIALRDFFNTLATVEADLFIFMARKALRLYDLFLTNGFRPIQRPVFSHHVLDQKLDLVQGKRVVLVDDTMILGTTLRRTRDELIQAGASSVQVFVFARDVQVSLPEIIDPDYVGLDLNSDEVKTFCAAEVAAFAIEAIPYLSDFPVSVFARYTQSEFERLLTTIEWEAHQVGDKRSDRSAPPSTFTFLPTDDAIRRFTSLYGVDLTKYCEIVKVRMFVRAISESAVYCRFVPIVTIRPLDNQTISDAFNLFASRFGLDGEIAAQELEDPSSKIRFFQYLLSNLIFGFFQEGIKPLLGRRRIPPIDLAEVRRHFSGHALKLINFLTGPKRPTRKLHFLFSQFDHKPKAKLPGAVSTIMAQDVVAALELPGRSNRRPRSPQESFADLIHVFVELYSKLELPAREEVRRAALSGNLDFSQLRMVNRLRMGVSWGTLLKYVFKQKDSWKQRLQFSVLLDRLVDSGIAVPALISEANKTFRIYRHGEDVLLGEQEYALCYLAVQAYLASSNRETIPKIDAEKLLVLLIKIGSGLNLISQTLGDPGDDRWARVGYHLHGAVMHLEPRDQTVFAGPNENWLTSRLLDRQIFQRGKSGYELGTCPQASFQSSSTAEFAKTLGHLIGDLRRVGDEILTDDDLAVLVSAQGRLETLGALGAELKLVADRFRSELLPELSRLSLDDRDRDRLVSFRKSMRSSMVVAALASGRMKYAALQTDRARSISQQVSEHFMVLRGGGALKSVWDSYTPHLKSLLAVHSEHEVSSQLEKIGVLLVEATSAVLVLELAISSALCSGGNKNFISSFEKTCRSCDYFLVNFFDAFGFDEARFGAIRRIREISTSKTPIERTEEAVAFGTLALKSAAQASREISSSALRTSHDVGHSSRTISYSSYVWYDIVNSKGSHLTQDSDEFRDYRSKVARFRDSVNRSVMDLTVEVSQNKGVMKGPPGVDEDPNDGKVFFFSGSGARSYANKYIAQLLNLCAVHDVRIRIACLPANLVGSSPFSVAGSPVIHGIDFLETVSVVLRDIKLDSKRIEASETAGSLLWLGGQYHSDIFSYASVQVTQIDKQRIIPCEVSGYRNDFPFSVSLVFC